MWGPGSCRWFGPWVYRWVSTYRVGGPKRWVCPEAEGAPKSWVMKFKNLDQKRNVPRRTTRITFQPIPRPCRLSQTSWLVKKWHFLTPESDFCFSRLVRWILVVPWRGRLSTTVRSPISWDTSSTSASKSRPWKTELGRHRRHHLFLSEETRSKGFEFDNILFSAE